MKTHGYLVGDNRTGTDTVFLQSNKSVGLLRIWDRRFTYGLVDRDDSPGTPGMKIELDLESVLLDE